MVSGIGQIAIMRSQAPPVLLPRCLFWGSILLGALGFLAMLLPIERAPLTQIFFYRQDLPALGLMLVLLTLILVALPRLARRECHLERRGLLIALMILSFGITLAGSLLVFEGYVLTRDEFMVLFDAQILRHWDGLARVPEAWQAFVPAMAPLFRFPVNGGAAWMSAYLPGNALLYALLGPLMGPILVSASIFLTHAIALRLWPASQDLALVAAFFVGLSPQVLISGMTPYAMNAHLACNLLWLWCFLRNDIRGHAGAIATGFLATGLHQLIFHPVFVAPFIVMLWLSRRRWLALIYFGAYALIGLFWMNWFGLLLGLHGLSGDSVRMGALATAQQLLNDFAWSSIDLTVKNVLRFFTWSCLLLLPFVCLALAGWRQLNSIFWALLVGIVLTTAVVFVLQPYQGHGWGFRYWHGLIGSFALLAAAGFARLDASGPARQMGRTLVCLSAVISLGLQLPLRAWQAHDFSAPYAKAYRAIRAVDAPAVVIDRTGRMFAGDLARNDPFLRNRPLLFDLGELSATDISLLCASGPVVVFRPQDAGRFGIEGFDEPPSPATERRKALNQQMNELQCGLPMPEH